MNRIFSVAGFAGILCMLLCVPDQQSSERVFFSQAVFADGPGDNNPESVRPVPPPGDALNDIERKRLLLRAKGVQEKISTLVKMTDDPENWLPDVEVFPRSVVMAVEGGTFYQQRDVATADLLLDLAESRLEGVRQGLRGLPLLMLATEAKEDHYFVVGGFRSKIDQSIQPYGLMVPTKPVIATGSEGSRLDVWLHGRGERDLELQFLGKRLHDRGYYAPQGAYVLHPFGRYSNAFKFAGEVDVFEAIQRVKTIADIDNDRVSIRGFSMGGAGCWQFAVHYPGHWMAATPGAGFCETREFLKSFQGDDYPMDEAMRKLLNWYDCPPWVNNLRNLPVVAYSGEIDRQRQAAELMVDAAKSCGFVIPHVIGPETGHSIHEDSKAEITQMMDEWTRAGRPLFRRQLDFTTYTLRYSQCDWIHILGLKEHWQESRVRGVLRSNGSIDLETMGIMALKVSLLDKQTEQWIPSGKVQVDGTSLSAVAGKPGVPWELVLRKVDGRWQIGEVNSVGLRKVAGLQGPIDDAFLDSFVVVKPSGISEDVALQKWIDAEIEHFRREWRSQFRGDIREVSDANLSEETIAANHLVLFGDPKSNRVLARIANQLPMTWDHKKIQIGGHFAQAKSNVLAMIYPNPLNPRRYLVINSGFTYRPYAYLNNARQIPHLPDWAIIDISGGANARLPGKILFSGFFDEAWKAGSN